jgi:hypothetical protein
MQDDKELALIDLREINLFFRLSRCVEETTVPSDAVVVEYTWKKCNKDGSPDRRFANNYRIPVAGYGAIGLKSANGLNKEYQFSSFEKAERFAELFVDYQNKLRLLGACPPAAPLATPKELPAPKTTVSGAVRVLAPEYTLQCIRFLQTAEAISAQHATKVILQFAELFGADTMGFNGSRSSAVIERFVNDMAMVPAAAQAFLRRAECPEEAVSFATKSLRRPIGTNYSGWARTQLIVPFAMKVVSIQGEVTKFHVRDLDTLWVAPLVELGLDPQSACGACVPDQVHDRLKSAERLASPVLRDVTEEAVFDLVPFAGARREVAHANAQLQFVSQSL